MMSLDYYRNRLFLGEFTVADLLVFVDIEGEFSIGKNWLPVNRARKSRGRLEIFMDHSDDPDVSFPLSRKIVVDGCVVRVPMPEWSHLPGRCHEVRIRLEKEPGIL